MHNICGKNVYFMRISCWFGLDSTVQNLLSFVRYIVMDVYKASFSPILYSCSSLAFPQHLFYLTSVLLPLSPLSTKPTISTTKLNSLER